MDEMIELAGTDLLPNAILQNFKDALPKEVNRTIMILELDAGLKINDELKTLAARAERWYNFEQNNKSPSKVYSVSNRDDEIQKIWKEIRDLHTKVGHLQENIKNTSNNPVPGNSTSNSNNSSNFNSRKSENGNTGDSFNRRCRSRSQNPNGPHDRSKTPKRIDYNDPKNKEKCKWHILFGENAYHCIKPCIMDQLPLKPIPDRPTKDPTGSSN